MFKKNHILLAITQLFIAGVVFAAPVDDAYYSDRILICLKPNLRLLEKSYTGNPVQTGIAELDKLLAIYNITEVQRWLPNARPGEGDGDILLENIFRLILPQKCSDLEKVVREFNKLGVLLYSELEPIHRLDYTPNDPRFSQQWYLQRIQADEAWGLWDITGGQIPGNRRIVLADIDTGVQYTHPDLRDRTWINQDEIPESLFATIDTDADSFITRSELVNYVGDVNQDGTADLRDVVANGSPVIDNLDNDNDGYVDDVLGWDPAGTTSGSDADIDPYAAMTGPAWIDYREHGTHVAGLLAATTDNGVGIASTIFTGTIMAVKCMYDQDAQAYVSSGYTGMLYAAHAGADIINCSWGGTGYSGSEQALINTIYNDYGVIIVAAAGNGNSDGTPSNAPHYPSGYDHVVSVTAVSASDVFSWANYGSGEGNPYFFGVDISAPGENILSTVFSNHGSYASWAGTSMASPIVASCFGLLKALYPNQTQEWLTNTILETADPIDDINPSYAGEIGSGRINIYKALARALYPDLHFNSYSLQLVNDDGDGQLSPGEEAWLRVTIFNSPGWVDAQDVVGYLTTTNPLVTITDSVGTFNTISAGNIGVNIFDRFQFSVAPEAPAQPIEFQLHLEANVNSDHPYETSFLFQVPVSFWQPGFPFAMGQPIIGGNAVVDIDGDGQREIIFGAEDSLLHCVGVDGAEKTGFPVSLGARIDATPAVGDLDGDGRLEIVIGAFNDSLYVIDSDGNKQGIWQGLGYLLAPPTLVDIDADQQLEIIIPDWGRQLAVLEADGTLLPGFPVSLPGERLSVGAAVGDLNHDGQLEIVAVSWGGALHVFNLAGEELPGFPVTFSGRIASGPLLVNLDQDPEGWLEIVVGADDDSLHVIDHEGNELWAFSGSSQNIRVTPGVGDINGDGNLELIYASYDRKIYALDNQGNLLPGWPVETGSIIVSSPVVVDVDGDGAAEIFCGSNDHKIYGLKGTGDFISGFPVSTPGRVQGTPTVRDFDQDGDPELIIGCDSSLIVLDLKTSAADSVGWFTDRGNYQRTGVYGNPVTGIGNQADLPRAPWLSNPYPNPFNPEVQLSLRLPQAMQVRVAVFDLRGRLVTRLVDNSWSAGRYEIVWNGRDEWGHSVGSGVYVLKADIGNRVYTRKLLFIK